MSEWKEDIFDNFIRLQRGFDLPNKDIVAGEYPIVASTAIKDYHHAYKVNPPGVVTGRSGSLGFVQYITEKYWPLNTALYVKNFKGNNPKYVYYFLQTMHLENFNAGAGVPTLNQNHLHKLTIKIPPLPVQQKIAAILSAYDDLIENSNKRIALLEKAAEEIYREWFVRMRFPGWDASGVKFVKGVPEGWEYLNFNNVTNNFDKKRIPLSGIERDKIKGEIPYYGAASILDHISKFIFDGKYLLIAEDGSVITQEGYPVLQFINEKFWVNNHAHIIQGKDNIFSTEWVYLSLKRYPILGHVTGVAQPKINQENLNRIKLLIPKTQILEEFNKIVVPVFEEIFLLKKSILRLKQSRDLLLSRLISGKLSVEGLDVRMPPSMEVGVERG